MYYNNKFLKKEMIKKGGYIALMATIIISLVLLVMTVEEGSSGWYSRFNILGTEAKEQANALAEGCADQALASIVTDPAYFGDATTTTVGGVCHVFPIEFNTPAQGFVTIKTQAEVRDSYANLEMTMNLNEIHLGTPSPSKGTLVIITQVINDGSGTKQASDFTMHVAATNPSQNPFAGSDNGVAVTVDSGAYNVTEDPLSGYATTVSTNCSGTVTSGQIKFCTITNDDIMTTLTVIANVKNDNSGTNAPADFPLFIDGNPVSIGQRITVSSGAHTVSATLLSGYAASPWGYDCASGGTITVNLGQSKTCIINYDDLPPPAPSCADTVMILDRTGSMSSSDMANEKIAASSLNSLYAGVLPPALPPHLGVGSIGGLDGSAASIPLLGQLSTVYANITSAINSITSSNSSVGSDLSAGITTASNELNSARHIAGNEKVLILVSDGDPNKPSGTQPFDTGFSSPTANVQNASGDLWSNPTNAYTGADAGADSSDVLSGANRHRFFNFGFGGGTGLPAGSTVTGIEAQANAWNTSTSVGATTSPLVPSGSGTYDQWTANTGTDVSAVAGNDGDTSYIDTSVSVDTFTVANAGVPAGSTINSVTITAVARSTTAGAPLQLVAEKSGTLSLDPVPKTLTTSYTTYTRTMNTDPTGATWTLAEVNAWTTHFGVRTTNAAQTPRVTQFFVTVNYNPAGNTALKSPTTATGAPNNQFTNPTRAFASDNSYATDATNGHVQGYATFAMGVPAGATIAGINVAVEAKSTDGSGCEVGAELSSNGSTFTTSGSTATLSTTDSVYNFGGSASLWGRSWILSDVNGATFTVRLQDIDPGFSCTNGSTLSVDQVQASVYYNLPAVNTAALAPVSGGTYDQWTANTGTDVSAVAGNDGDTSYIDTSVSVDTFTVANAGVPAGSTINSVTITAVARSTTAGAPLQLVAEKSGTLSLDPVPKTLTTSYTTYTRTMNTDPTGATWTLAEVNAWTSRFGVRTTNGTTIPRVTQLSVSVNYVAPSVCQLGVDLSWNAGTSWSSEKTQTLTGIEVPYVLGTASDKWGAHTWVPTDFTNANFRARVHAINPGAGCSASTIDHLDWLQVKVHYTQVVDPIQASLNAADAAKLGGIDLFTIHFGSDPGPYQGNKLLANLASGTTTVTYNSVTHQNGSLAQAGGVVSSDTGLIAPTIATAPNQWTNPTRAFVSDNSYTTDVVNGHQQGFTTFGFSIPPTAIINGIALSVETKSSDTSGCQVGAELSSNNGTSFTTTGTNAGVSGSDVAYTLGGAASLWGRSWVPSDFSNGSFVVRLQNIDPGSACVNGSTLSTDQIRARVYYTVNTENGDGDNFFIAPTSADMQGIFNFIGEQVCPAALNLASAPPPTTGTLIVMTQVINNNGGASTSADFIANISAINPSQTSFAGVASGVTVTVDPGDYSVTENSATGYNEIPGATCSSGGSLGPIVAGETRVCVLTNDDIPPPPPPPNFNINTGSWEEVPDAQ